MVDVVAPSAGMVVGAAVIVEVVASATRVTVTVAVWDAPPSAVAVMVAVPLAIAVTSPLASTVATDSSSLLQVKVAPLIWPNGPSATADSCTVAPAVPSVGSPGVTSTEAPRTPRKIAPFCPTTWTEPFEDDHPLIP